MKRILLIALSFICLNTFAQSLPSTKVKDLSGKIVNTAYLNNSGKPMIISFWATWCKPCVTELSAIHDLYEDWQEETGVKLVAVSIDDARNSSKVLPFVNSKAWDYNVLLDVNGDFKRAMSVVNIPHTFLLDGKGNIVYQHTSYAPGDENELYSKLKALN